MGYHAPGLPKLNFLLLDDPLLVGRHQLPVEGVKLLLHY